jgi:hypothetical protein
MFGKNDSCQSLADNKEKINDLNINLINNFPEFKKSIAKISLGYFHSMVLTS